MPAYTITSPSPWATRSTMLISANHSPTRRHTRCLPSLLYSKNRDSSMKRTPLQSARCHRMWAFTHSRRLWRRHAVRSRSRWGRRACRWASLRRFLTVCAEMIWLCNRLLQQLSEWLVSDDLGGEDAGCGGPRLVWLHVVCGCEAGCMYCQILWNAFGDGFMVDKWTFNSRATALVDIPAVSMPTSVALCCVCASLRHTCAIIMLSNQHLDMPQLWGGWIISAKEKCSLTQI